MKLTPLNHLLVASLLLIGSATAQAAVSDAEAQQLNSTLTPLGGERAGNADGSIPAWDSGFKQVPAGVSPAEARRPGESVHAMHVGRCHGGCALRQAGKGRGRWTAEALRRGS